MNKTKLFLPAILLLLLASLIFVLPGCGATTTPSTPATQSPAVTNTSVPTTPVVLTITNGTQKKTFSLAQLQALIVTTGFGGQKSKTNAITGPYALKGVLLADLLTAAGGITSANSVKVTASDNYSKTFSYAQITSPTFNTYDLTGNTATAEVKPVLVLVYEMDGKALADTTGPVELGVVTSKNQVTDGSSWIKMTKQIDIVAAAQ
jgi:hypothetical protein